MTKEHEQMMDMVRERLDDPVSKPLLGLHVLVDAGTQLVDAPHVDDVLGQDLHHGGELGKRLDGELGSDFAGFVAAHAVGDGEERGQHEEAVLVARAFATHIRYPGGFNHNHRLSRSSNR